MTHIGEEPALRTVGPFGILLSLTDLVILPADKGDLDYPPDHKCRDNDQDEYHKKLSEQKLGEPGLFDHFICTVHAYLSGS